MDSLAHHVLFPPLYLAAMASIPDQDHQCMDIITIARGEEACSLFSLHYRSTSSFDLAFLKLVVLLLVLLLLCPQCYTQCYTQSSRMSSRVTPYLYTLMLTEYYQFR